ncbi:MAG TPA: hypothetical protein VJN44_14765 [Roseateles sp.]|nr:hypothetical protein [Roseateles sp.]
MELDLLMKRYASLRQKLAMAYEERPWESSRIDQIADDLAETEKALAAAQRRAQPASVGAPLF